MQFTISWINPNVVKRYFLFKFPLFNFALGSKRIILEFDFLSVIFSDDSLHRNAFVSNKPIGKIVSIEA